MEPARGWAGCSFSAFEADFDTTFDDGRVNGARKTLSFELGTAGLSALSGTEVPTDPLLAGRRSGAHGCREWTTHFACGLWRWLWRCWMRLKEIDANPCDTFLRQAL